MSDWDLAMLGVRILKELLEHGLNSIEGQIASGTGDISKMQKNIYEYRKIIKILGYKISREIEKEIELRNEMSFVENTSEIVQAARDGILLKQEKRIEIIDGEEKKIIYDTTITEREVINTLSRYQSMKNEILMNKVENYLGIGLSVAGIVGTVFGDKQDSKEKKVNTESIITLGIFVARSLKLIHGMVRDRNREELWEVARQRSNIKWEIFDNEPISDIDKERMLSFHNELLKKELEIRNKTDNIGFSVDISTEIIMTLLTGAYFNSNVQIKENGEFDGKDFVSAIMWIDNAREQGSEIFSMINSITRTQKDEQEFSEVCKLANQIINQMEEKVYPLQGATHSFDSLSINNFVGNFHPRRDYETGEIKYLATIEIPEFSMKRGDVVLLSGESGAGKSTFLRLLKRGDIDNRNKIKINDGQMIDKIGGKEYMSFKPDMKLGNESSVLFQITGKKSISALTEQEKKNLLKILEKLNFNQKNLLDNLATKKFSEFSTGQQKRLAISKLFYKIEDGASVIIVDEPGEGVGDELVRKQLEMIVKYAKKKNVMLILTTHRLNLAEDLATKRYHINKEGVMEQLPVAIKENDEKKNDGRLV